MTHGGGHHGGHHSGGSLGDASSGRGSHNQGHNHRGHRHQQQRGIPWFGGMRSLSGWQWQQYNFSTYNSIYNGDFNSYQQMPLTNSALQDECRQIEECERCCTSLCRNSCCSSNSSPVRRNPNFGIWIFASVTIFFIALIASAKDEVWTFNGGESRQVSQPFLVEQVKIHSDVANALQVYALDRACPPLTGPTVTLKKSIDVALAINDYQYDFFYLNAGSTLDITLTQSEKGATTVLLIRGKHNLDRWEDDDDSFTNKNVLVQRYAGANQETRVRYTAQVSDFYVVVYDNASTASKGKVQYHAELTTYDLRDFSALSSSLCHLDTGAFSCSIPRSNKIECLLIQTNKEQQDVTVTITAERQWSAIVFLSLLPILISFLLNQKKKMLLHVGEETQQEQEQEQSFETTPATNPNYSVDPSAPLDNARTPLLTRALSKLSPSTLHQTQGVPPMAEAILAETDYGSNSVPIAVIGAEDAILVPPPTYKVLNNATGNI